MTVLAKVNPGKISQSDRLISLGGQVCLSEDRPREAKELLKEARRLGLMSCSVWIFSFSNGCVYESNG